MRALAGLFMLAILAVAGIGTYGGPQSLASLLPRGLAGFEFKPAVAATQAPDAVPPPVSVRPIRIITQTVAISEPEPPALPAARLEAARPAALEALTPVTGPSTSSVVTKAMKATAHGATEKRPGSKFACAAGQHFDRVHHTCKGGKRSEADQLAKPLG